MPAPDDDPVRPEPVVLAVMLNLEGMLVTPLVLGRRFALNPVFVFVWLIFWGWLWGIPGGLLALPLLTIVKIVSERIPALASLAGLLGRD